MKKPIAAIIKPTHIKMAPMPIIVSIAPNQINVPAVRNKFWPERSANAWRQFLIYFTASNANIKPMIKQIPAPKIVNNTSPENMTNMVE